MRNECRSNWNSMCIFTTDYIYTSWYSMPAVKGYLEISNWINVTKLYRPGNSPEQNQIENLENCQKQSCRLVYQFNSQHALLPPRSNQKQRRSYKIRIVKLFGLKWIENFFMFTLVIQTVIFSNIACYSVVFKFKIVILQGDLWLMICSQNI